MNTKIIGLSPNYSFTLDKPFVVRKLMTSNDCGLVDLSSDIKQIPEHTLYNENLTFSNKPFPPLFPLGEIRLPIPMNIKAHSPLRSIVDSDSMDLVDRFDLMASVHYNNQGVSSKGMTYFLVFRIEEDLETDQEYFEFYKVEYTPVNSVFLPVLSWGVKGYRTYSQEEKPYKWHLGGYGCSDLIQVQDYTDKGIGLQRFKASHLFPYPVNSPKPNGHRWNTVERLYNQHTIEGRLLNPFYEEEEGGKFTCWFITMGMLLTEEGFNDVVTKGTFPIIPTI